MLWLIGFRALQGLGAGALQPLTITILSDLYTGKDRASVLAWQSSVWGIAAIVGPVIGAFIVAYVNWAYVFWINLPVGAVTLVVLSLAFDEHLERRDHQIDYLGSASVDARRRRLADGRGSVAGSAAQFSRSP